MALSEFEVILKGSIQQLNHALRLLVVPRILRDAPVIVIASSGRAGSTILYEAVREGLLRLRFGVESTSIRGRLLRVLCTDFVERIAEIDKTHLAVCKTHDTYAEPTQRRCRFVFVYGDPLDTALSVARMTAEWGETWFYEHQRHLRASGGFENLFKKDVLNYEEQLETWLGQRRDNVLCIDYDDLWDSQDRLSDFVGFAVKLPARCERQTADLEVTVDPKLFARLRECKARLKHKYLETP